MKSLDDFTLSSQIGAVLYFASVTAVICASVLFVANHLRVHRKPLASRLPIAARIYSHDFEKHMWNADSEQVLSFLGRFKPAPNMALVCI